MQIGIRPEHLNVSVPDSTTPSNGLGGTVTLVEELGADANVHANTAYGPVTARTTDSPESLPPIGGTVVFTPADNARIYFFDGVGSRILD